MFQFSGLIWKISFTPLPWTTWSLIKKIKLLKGNVRKWNPIFEMVCCKSGGNDWAKHKPVKKKRKTKCFEKAPLLMYRTMISRLSCCWNNQCSSSFNVCYCFSIFFAASFSPFPSCSCIIMMVCVFWRRRKCHVSIQIS